MNKKQTHYDRILGHLKEYGSITSWESFEMFGVTRLSAIIYLLRQDGYNIESVDTTSKNRYGDTVHFATYVLKGE